MDKPISRRGPQRAQQAAVVCHRQNNGKCDKLHHHGLVTVVREEEIQQKKTIYRAQRAGWYINKYQNSSKRMKRYAEQIQDTSEAVLVSFFTFTRNL